MLRLEPSARPSPSDAFEANIAQAYQAWKEAAPAAHHQGWLFLYSSRRTFGPAARIVILGHNPCPVPLRDGGYGEIGSYTDALGGRHPFGPYVERIRGSENMPYGWFASNIGILLRAVARNLKGCQPAELLEQTLISNFFPFASDRLEQPLESAEASRTFLLPGPVVRLPSPPGAPPRATRNLEQWASDFWRTILIGHGSNPPVLTPDVLIVGGYYWRRRLLPNLGIPLVPGRIETSVDRGGRSMHVFALPHTSRAEWNVPALTASRRIASLIGASIR
ncbi:MAG: hypothetical protein KY467_17835 [Gemmatimonadetes bacterium]|nr:hypothetical protein [Gemmatimonadota bacterium]